MVSHDDVLMPRVKTVKLETEFNVVGLVIKTGNQCVLVPRPKEYLIHVLIFGILPHGVGSFSDSKRINQE